MISSYQIFKRLERFGLKMKREKCNFFKKHIQYLGHLITEEGFTPLPEKPESIRKMPRPKTPKEVKQFLGLIEYYRKFVPRFLDIARSLTNLTRHDVDFKWTEKCDKAFKHLKELLMEHPILRYPDPEWGYTLFKDASGIGWAGVLTQVFTDKKGKKKHHPHFIRKWPVPREPTKLGGAHERSLCHLHVREEAQFLHYRCRSDNQVRSPAFKEISSETNTQCKS